LFFCIVNVDFAGRYFTAVSASDEVAMLTGELAFAVKQTATQI